MQSDALVELHVRVDVPFASIVSGSAESEMVGVGCGVVFTVISFWIGPPAPVQLSMYVVVAETVTFWFPESALEPVHPPEAVHEVAFVEVQASVEVPPACIVVGVAVKVSVGAPGEVGVTFTVTDFEIGPFGPVQLSA